MLSPPTRQTHVNIALQWSFHKTPHEKGEPCPYPTVLKKKRIPNLNLLLLLLLQKSLQLTFHKIIKMPHEKKTLPQQQILNFVLFFFLSRVGHGSLFSCGIARFSDQWHTSLTSRGLRCLATRKADYTYTIDNRK